MDTKECIEFKRTSGSILWGLMFDSQLTVEKLRNIEERARQLAAHLEKCPGNCARHLEEQRQKYLKGICEAPRL